MEPGLKPDYVSELVRTVSAVASLDPEAEQRAAAAIRGRFGGQKLRIDPREPITVEKIDAGLRARQPVREIAADLGVSRATIYRMLGKSRGKRAVRHSEP